MEKNTIVIPRSAFFPKNDDQGFFRYKWNGYPILGLPDGIYKRCYEDEYKDRVMIEWTKPDGRMYVTYVYLDNKIEEWQEVKYTFEFRDPKEKPEEVITEPKNGNSVKYVPEAEFNIMLDKIRRRI